MANIFKQNLDITEHPNRNNHDLSHKVHGTYKMGYIYPFLCKPVVPNDSFRIDTACGFQLMPMPFPTQSNIRCIFHYFYVRNKNIWENWENWHEGLEEHTPPYINQGSDFYKTGSLADYLDIPTTIVRQESITINDSNPIQLFTFNSQPTFSKFLFTTYTPPIVPLGSLLGNFTTITDDEGVYSGSYLYAFKDWGDFATIYNRLKFNFKVPASLLFADPSDASAYTLTYFNRYCRLVLLAASSPTSDYKDMRIVDTINDSVSASNTITQVSTQIEGETYYYFKSEVNLTGDNLTTFINTHNSLFNDGEVFTIALLIPAHSDVVSTNPLLEPPAEGLFQTLYNNPTGIYELKDVNSNPYYGGSNTGDDTLKISALPFRAYESIYYAYYANSVLQPLKINGETKYNRYNTTLEDGADATPYHLFQRNWELDAYTSCLPSPQQGDMPLVGITDAGDLRVSDPNTGEQSRFHLIQDGDRQTIQVDNVSNPEHSRLALDLVTSGITIPDFREVNAYQRLKEQALRSGYKYKDFVKGNFGISPKQNELDMPEFIGGFSQRVDVNMISNTNGITPDGSSDVLGSFAGQGRAFGGSKHGISHYFDDYGWVIGVMMIVPDCAYSQLLPKHFIYNERLDYYFPQFAQLGLQPITYGEVAPIQSHLQYTGGASNKLLTDVFGYQRPNHEYVWYPDSIHGQIRKSLNNIVINRVFDKRPELSDEFLKIDPKDTDKIFAVTEDDNDVVVGQIAMKITAKRPIPRIVIPTLGR